MTTNAPAPIDDWDAKAARIHEFLTMAEEEQGIKFIAMVLREAHQMGVLDGIEKCQHATEEVFGKWRREKTA